MSPLSQLSLAVCSHHVQRYIHASYRFIVDPRGNYRAQAADADVHLDWNDVLQILASAQSQLTSCPICLSTPVAPRMAKCGHIFCLPCLIRYMHSANDTNPVPEKKARWKKCPICWDSVYLSETRPVRWLTGQEGEAPREGADVVLRLIMRQAGSTLALPRDGAESLSKYEDVPWYFAAEVIDYARVMKGSEDYMILHFDREIEELRLQEKEDELMFGEESQWTRKAVVAITEAKEKLKGIGNPPNAPKKSQERKSKRPPIIYHEISNEVPEFYFIQHAARSGQSLSATPGNLPDLATVSSSTIKTDLPSSIQTNSQLEIHGPTSTRSSLNGLEKKTSISRAPTIPDPNRGKDNESGLQITDETAFFFYQALLHYYLSPLDIRILKAAFGDFSSFPSTILPRVERVSTGHIVDDELRKRAKYLAHLPHGCEVSFLECDWTDTVVPEVLDRFSGEIERRRKRNREKEVREEKERVRAEKEEDDKRWAAARRKRPSISKDPIIDSTFQLQARQEDSMHISFPENLSASSSSPPWLFSQNRNGSAFASLASPSTSPAAPRTIWGTSIVAPASPPLQPANYEQDSTENDGWLQGWERDLLQDEELVSQVQASSIGEGSSQVGSMIGNGHKGKGKKKKITLMTTNARRGA